MQHEFDALVCFAYNPGGKMTRLAGYVNQGKIALSMDTIKSANTSGGVVNNGLIKRRELEVTLYMYNNYGKLRII